MCLGDDNIPTIKRRKLFIPANYILNTPVFAIWGTQAEAKAGVTQYSVEVLRGEEGILKGVNSLSSVQQKIWQHSSPMCYLFLAIFRFWLYARGNVLG